MPVVHVHDDGLHNINNHRENKTKHSSASENVRKI